jgi:hypothetical protein
MENKKPILIVDNSTFSQMTDETLSNTEKIVTIAKEKGASICLVGAGSIGMSARIAEMAAIHDVEIILAESGDLGRTIREVTAVDNKPMFIKNDLIIKGLGEDLPKLSIEEMAKPYLNKLNDLDMVGIKELIQDSIPNKLQLLKDLNLSKEQIDYFKNTPNERMEGEKQEDYKTRRMLNKLLIKFRGQY